MKRLVFVLLLCLAGAATVLAATVKDVTSTEARAMIIKNRNVFIVDVRTHQEWNQGYIASASLIPIDSFEKRLAEIPKNRPVIVYCAVGSRSRVVAQGLSQLGYPEVYNMREGMVGWARNGYPVQR